MVIIFVLLNICLVRSRFQ